MAFGSATPLARRSQSAAETRDIGCKICPSTGKVAKVAGSGERLRARREREVDELRLPAGAVTGVGSLPHTDPAVAAAYVLERWPDLPAIPSLPRRSPHETMLGQAVVGVRGVQVTADGTLDVDPRRMDAAAKVTPDLDHEAFAGLRA